MPTQVAVGVILDRDGTRVLLAKRAPDAHQGGLWEFPGGKVEEGETLAQALVRELDEELAITATRYQPLLRVDHDYADKAVALDVWLVTAFEGKVKGVQGQQLRWVSIDQLPDIDFPLANRAIVAKLQQGCLIKRLPGKPAQLCSKSLDSTSS